MNLKEKGIEGLLSDEDMVFLRTLANETTFLRGNYFEVGSLYGLSALTILDGIGDSGGLRAHKPILCFDWFEPDKLKKFRANIESQNRSSEVMVFPGDFRTHSWVKHHDFCFGFIDHDHRLGTTVSAYEMFWPTITVGGWLAFHDYGHPQYPEPTPFFDSLKHPRKQAGGVIAFQKT